MIFVRLRRDKIWARWVLTVVVNSLIIVIISESTKLAIRGLRGLFLIVSLRYFGFRRYLSHLINSYINISKIWPSVTILEITPTSSCIFLAAHVLIYQECTRAESFIWKVKFYEVICEKQIPSAFFTFRIECIGTIIATS